MNKKLKNIKEPFVMILIGPPLCGKTTWIQENFPDTEVISQDETYMEVYGSRNYEEAFKGVNQKEVKAVMNAKLIAANKAKQNVIIDMTHMFSKRRRVNLSYFSDDFYKVGIIFPIPTDEEMIKRNEKRIAEENKDMPLDIVKNSFISRYQTIRDEEGFDKIISL